MAEFNPPLPQLSGSVLRLTVDTTMPGGAGRAFWSVYYMATVGGVIAVAETLDQAANAFHVNMQASYLDCLPTDATHFYTHVDDLKNPALQAWHEVAGSPGTVTDDSCPPFVQCTIRKATRVRGKRGRGRVQIPCVPETFQTDGVLSGTGLGAYSLLRDDLMLTIGTTTPSATWKPCMAYRGALGGDGLYAMHMEEISAFVLRTDLGSQNRRKIGRGL